MGAVSALMGAAARCKMCYEKEVTVLIETYYRLSSRMKEELQKKYCPDPRLQLMKDMQVILIGEAAALMRYTGTSEVVELPQEWNGHPLKIIGTAAFAGHHQLRSLTVPAGVEEIAAYALYGCPQVLLRGETGSAAEQYAARWKIPFESMEYGYELTPEGTVRLTAYRGSATEITIPQKLLGKPVTVIGESAFENHSSLVSVTIPEGLTDIGSRAFCQCASLREVRLPQTVQIIGSSAFWGCRQLQQVNLQQVTRLGEGVFGQCTTLENVRLPEGVEYVSPYAFTGCLSLREVGLPGSLRQIGAHAFQNCRSLKRLEIPFQVSYTASDAFDGCGQLTLAVLQGSSAEKSVRSTGLALKLIAPPQPETPSAPEIPPQPYTYQLSSDGFAVLTGYSGQETAVQVPSEIDGIQVVALTGTFRNHANVSSVTLPEGIRIIGTECFENCGGLKTVSLPDSLQAIHKDAFRGCTGLSQLTLPVHLAQIGASAFDGCTALGNLFIPNRVNVVGDSAFRGCRRLISIRLPVRLRKAGKGLFAGCASLQNITLPEGVTELEPEMLEGCAAVDQINLPATLKTIDPAAFASCVHLKSLQAQPASSFLSVGGVLLDKTGKKLLCVPQGQQAEVYTLPAGVETIGAGAFYGCRFLKTITAQQDTEITEIGAGAFENCENLKEINIALSAQRIEDRVFKNCRSMSWMELPPGVTEIGREAFAGCSRMERVVVPGSVRSIGENAFAGCPKLKLKVKSFSYAQRYAKAQNIPFESGIL